MADELLLNRYSNTEVLAFLGDIAGSVGTLHNNVSILTAEIIATWKYLYTKHATKAPNARKDWNTLVQFGKLNDNVKEYIVKFADASATNSSLIKFCADLPKPLGGGSDVKFIDYVNNVDNLNVVKNFVGHKLNETAFNSEYEQISEAEADLSLVGLAKDWVKRSIGYTKTQQYFRDGIDYGNHAATNLLSPNSTLARDLGINMNEYYLFREVYLYVQKGVPNKEDQFTKADILLVKYDGQRIDNVILLETKISGSTEYTPRQKQSYRIIERGGVDKIGVFELKSSRAETKLLNGTIFTDEANGKSLNVSTISINKNNAYKISDTGLKNGALNKSSIDTGRYFDYVAPDNK